MKQRKVNCPSCGKIVVWETNPFRPFCSERCKTNDLAQWATESYRIPETEQNLDQDPKEQ
ncbi:MAG: DNA gyrase inhibitor YacG [Nitrosomonas sp.]|nr:DNA gyrase inhibitor YacG [Nitrosomonas sp.]